MRVIGVVMFAALVACGRDPAPSSAPDPAPPRITTTVPAPAGVPESPLASLVEPAGDLRYDPADNRIGATPATLTIDGIAVTAAPIVPVSVDAAGELAIPGASEVGWYRFGARPGDAGSAVLAAHIAFDGRDGVFRWLADVEPGTRIVIGYVDGTTSTFMVTDTAQYGKDELPADIFRSSGDPRVVLITCGGSFNRALRSYEDNVVVYAEPE